MSASSAEDTSAVSAIVRTDRVRGEIASPKPGTRRAANVNSSDLPDDFLSIEQACAGSVAAGSVAAGQAAAVPGRQFPVTLIDNLLAELPAAASLHSPDEDSLLAVLDALSDFETNLASVDGAVAEVAVATDELTEKVETLEMTVAAGLACMRAELSALSSQVNELCAALGVRKLAAAGPASVASAAGPAAGRVCD